MRLCDAVFLWLRNIVGFRPAGCTLVRGNHVLLARPGCRSGQERGSGARAAQALPTILCAGWPAAKLKALSHLKARQAIRLSVTAGLGSVDIDGQPIIIKERRSGSSAGIAGEKWVLGGYNAMFSRIPRPCKSSIDMKTPGSVLGFCPDLRRQTLLSASLVFR